MKRIRYFEEAVLAFLLIAMTLILGLQILFRYVFGNSLTWSEELVRYLFVWSTFLGVPYCIKHGKSLKVLQVLEILPKKVRRVVIIVDVFIMLAFFIVLFVASSNVVIKAFLDGQKSPALGIPIYMVYLSVVVGSMLSIFRIFQKILSVCRSVDCLDEASF